MYIYLCGHLHISTQARGCFLYPARQLHQKLGNFSQDSTHARIRAASRTNEVGEDGQQQRVMFEIADRDLLMWENCVVVCCSVLQCSGCVAVWCNSSQCVAVS